MNTLLALAAIALALGGPAAAVAPAFLAPTCQDLGGQGYACADVRDDGADVEVVVAPTIPPVALALAPVDPACQDLAGRGTVCTEGTSATYDIEVAEVGLSSSGSVVVGV